MTNSNYILTKAKDNNIPEILELTLGMWHEAQTFYPMYNKNLMVRFMKPIVNNGNCLILIKDKKIVGAIGGVVARWWFAESEYLADAFFFVEKEHRSFQNARSLIQGLNKIAKTKNIPLVMGTFDANDIERKDMLFEKLNFRKLGIRYGYGL